MNFSGRNRSSGLSLLPADVTAVADLAFAVSRSPSDPDLQASRLLHGIRTVISADGAAFFLHGASGTVPRTREGRWDRLDTQRLAEGFAADAPETTAVGGVWDTLNVTDAEGSARTCIDRQGRRLCYLCSGHYEREHRNMLLAVRRPEIPFTNNEAVLLRGIYDSAVSRLLIADRRVCEYDQGLSPRARQILAGLKGGGSEKELAADLQISVHTVHVYVKRIYRHFRVHSRGELMRLWVRD